jgi:hypothetical protein
VNKDPRLRTRLVFKTVAGKQRTQIYWSKVKWRFSNLVAFSKNTNFKNCPSQFLSQCFAVRNSIFFLTKTKTKA